MAFRRRAPKEPTPPELSPLSISESQWRGQQLEAARRLVERYCDTSEMPPSLTSLDAVVTAWFDDQAADRADVNDLVNAVGIALGHHVVAATDLIWVLATDETGSEIALHRAAGDVLVYPTNLVAKRIVDDERDFVQPLCRELVARIQESAGAAPEPAGEPGYASHSDRDGDGVACENEPRAAPATRRSPRREGSCR